MESVFATIADPTRRRILEVLRTSGPLSVKALADPLPISRQAVTKHLDILSSSGLIQIERVGRERLHRLDPHSLREVADWLEPYEAFWDERLARLKCHLDQKRD
jgi:DNA-binding transcriptional ArsR family regulator